MKKGRTNKNQLLRGGQISKELHALHMNMKGVPLIQAGKMGDAMQAFDDAIELDPSLASSWFNKGYILSSEGNYEKAIEAFEKAIEIDHVSAPAWNGKGYILTTTGKHEKALHAYEEAIEIDSTFAYPWNGMGNSLAALDRYEEALEAFEQAIEIDPLFAHPWNGKAFIFRNDPNLESLSSQSAEQCFLRAIHLCHSETQLFPLVTTNLIDFLETFNLPLLAKEILTDLNITAADPEYMDLISDIDDECDIPLGILLSINTHHSMNEIDKELWSGITNFYYGNPMRAYQHFDAVDSIDETNLTAQYYLILSLQAYLEKYNKESSFAVKQAETQLKQLGPETPPEQAYYAGQILYITQQKDKALKCFEHNNNHLPSLYMQWLCLYEQNPSKAGPIMTILLKEERKEKRSKKDTTNPSQPIWMETLRKEVYAREIEPASQLISQLSINNQQGT